MNQETPGLIGQVKKWLDTGAGIAVAMAVMSISTYGYQILAARLLGPQGYSPVGAMMNLLLVTSVVSLGLQATAARRISSDPDHVAQIENSIWRVTWRASLALGLVLLAAAPVINQVLKLESLATAALVGPTALLITMMGGQAGVLQGERKWLWLGLVYVAAGLPRLLIGAGMLMWHRTEFVAIVAVMIASMAPVIVGWFALNRHERDTGSVSALHSGRALLRETFANSQALLAFFALSNLDLIVARNVLDRHDSGLYAGGLILTKAVLFLPQFVVVVAFPSMSTASERRKALSISLALVAGVGALCTAAAWVGARYAMVFVGGAKYGEIQDRLWLFAVLGTALAMLQLLVYSVLARQGQRTVLVIWAALAALITGGLFTSTLDGLLGWVIVVDAGLLVLLIGVSFWLLRRDLAPVEDDAALL